MRAIDPQIVGELLLKAREEYPDVPLHILADGIPWNEIPEIDKTMTLGKQQAREHQAQLELRALSGDRYAMSMLEGQAFSEPADE